MRKTLKEIAELIDGEIVGDGDTVITGISGIKEAEEGDITYVADSRYMPLLNQTRASGIIAPRGTSNISKPIIRTDEPVLSFIKLISELGLTKDGRRPKPGIHPTAVIAPGVKLGGNLAIGPHVVIEYEAEIGDGCILGAGVYIGSRTRIGCDVHICPNVTVRQDVVIGNSVFIYPGAVIGSDGFGFAAVRGVHHKIPQIGSIVIEDDVEIGANVTIDRATFGKTVIGKGTKIDNLVQIGHNVTIGENCMVVAQTGISGSSNIGKGVTLAGQSGIVDHVTIGENAVVAAQACVTKSVPPNTTVSGYPAKPHPVAKRINACVQRLPILFKIISNMEKKIKRFERVGANGVAANHKRNS